MSISATPTAASADPLPDCVEDLADFDVAPGDGWQVLRLPAEVTYCAGGGADRDCLGPEIREVKAHPGGAIMLRREAWRDGPTWESLESGQIPLLSAQIFNQPATIHYTVIQRPFPADAGRPPGPRPEDEGRLEDALVVAWAHDGILRQAVVLHPTRKGVGDPLDPARLFVEFYYYTCEDGGCASGDQALCAGIHVGDFERLFVWESAYDIMCGDAEALVGVGPPSPVCDTPARFYTRFELPSRHDESPALDDDIWPACDRRLPGCDNCPQVTNDDQLDFDGDGVGDACDCDIDGDGVYDWPDANGDERYDWATDRQHIRASCHVGIQLDPETGKQVIDNCRWVVNPDLSDIDGDDIGDVCDDDRDGDRVPNARDNCPDEPNERQADDDRDHIGNVCDPDRDGDYILDVFDNCWRYNPLQLDFDGLDNCEFWSPRPGPPGNRDGDGFADADDLCPDVPSAWQLRDEDGDGRGEVCDDDDDGDGLLDVCDPDCWGGRLNLCGIPPNLFGPLWQSDDWNHPQVCGQARQRAARLNALRNRGASGDEHEWGAQKSLDTSKADGWLK